MISLRDRALSRSFLVLCGEDDRRERGNDCLQFLIPALSSRAPAARMRCTRAACLVRFQVRPAPPDFDYRGRRVRPLDHRGRRAP